MSEIVPSNSRYIPFTQQRACCVPTCFQMIMYRHNIPLKPAEEIGYQLGLVVHPDREKLFYNVRTSLEKPPAGYGTRIYESEFEPNKAFQRMNIPLSFKIKTISQFDNSQEIIDYLRGVEKNDEDVLMCFNHGALIDDPTKDWGHVCVFDRLVENKIRLIDPTPDQPKWRLVTVEKMFEAMKKHGEKRSGGFWEIKHI
jgi:hypothetical protein